MPTNLTICSNVSSEQPLPDRLFPHSEHSTAGNIVLIVIMLTVISWTILGNLTVILSVKLSAKLRASPSNVLIANLAVSDLLLGTLVLPFSAMVEVYGYWPIGRELCFLWLITDVLLCTASIWGLLVIAVDRFTATFKPIWYRTRYQTCRPVLYITTVWLVSTLTSIPPLFGFGSMTKASFGSESPPQCTLFIRIDFVMYSSIMTFILPAIFLFLTYGRIYIEIRRRSLEINKMKTSFKKSMQASGAEMCQIEEHLQALESEESSSLQETNNEICETSDNSLLSRNDSKMSANKHESDNRYDQQVTPFADHCSEENTADVDDSNGKSCHMQAETEAKISLLKNMSYKRKKDKREEKATRVMLTIMLIFIVCWLPFFIMYITRSALSKTCDDCVSQPVQSFLTWLGYINSALNPLLYTVFNRQFRKAFRDIWSGKIRHLNQQLHSARR